jgi:hypothetical protein
VGESAARDWIVDEILVANGLRSHVARELAISGPKTYLGIYGFQLCEEDAHRVLEDGEEAVKHSREQENDLEDSCASASREIISHDWWRDAAAITEQEEHEMRKRFSEVVKNMAERAKAHTLKVHHSGPVVNQGVLSRLIAFQTEEGAFSWTRKRKAVAWRMHNEPNQTPGRFLKRSDALSVMLCFFSRRRYPWWWKESLIWNVFNRAFGDCGW